MAVGRGLAETTCTLGSPKGRIARWPVFGLEGSGVLGGPPLPGIFEISETGPGVFGNRGFLRDFPGGKCALGVCGLDGLDFGRVRTESSASILKLPSQPRF